MAINKAKLWEELPGEDNLYIDIKSRCLAKKEGDDLCVVGCAQQDRTCSACSAAKAQHKEIGACVGIDLQQFKRVSGPGLGSDLKMALWAIGSIGLIAVGVYGFVTF